MVKEATGELFGEVRIVKALAKEKKRTNSSQSSKDKMRNLVIHETSYEAENTQPSDTDDEGVLWNKERVKAEGKLAEHALTDWGCTHH